MSLSNHVSESIEFTKTKCFSETHKSQNALVFISFKLSYYYWRWELTPPNKMYLWATLTSPLAYNKLWSADIVQWYSQGRATVGNAHPVKLCRKRNLFTERKNLWISSFRKIISILILIQSVSEVNLGLRKNLNVPWQQGTPDLVEELTPFPKPPAKITWFFMRGTTLEKTPTFVWNTLVNCSWLHHWVYYTVFNIPYIIILVKNS